MSKEVKPDFESISQDNQDKGTETRTENSESISVEPIQSSDVSQDVVPASPSLDVVEQFQRFQAQVEEYKNLFLRKAAEFENYKKRTQQEFRTLINSAEEALISELLPVLDDFDRLLANSEGNSESLLRGAQLIRDKLMDLLLAKGLRPIEAVGTPFDPQFHEALLQQQDSTVEPGVVLQEHLRGYRLGDKVIRHTQVVVSG